MKNLPIIIGLALLMLSCKSPEARMPESVKSGSFLKESAERNKKLNDAEENQIEALIKSQPDKTFIASETGFWYHYIVKVENDTIQPEFGDIVNFQYNVMNIKGDNIYDTTTKTYIIDKEELFKGMREALKLMKPSESVTFIFPSQTAYGYYGDENKIGTNTPLICEVTLNSITQNND